ncbi:CDP-glycerol glycerophosphotransferase [Blastococcus colisei]|uniref:CDP-glycerol glycerophosphotransferase n=1 Tax=Blastococcus colisei TaxID=1564162 RepID=A0A543PJS9_9ACTN|nr:CDP-glycerol glycerophosphotransferase family protein [Blastococcus colisei]TQN44319.1 CDP-glycerol glycerophosphotransferase [Blastococcus colisei]
MRIVYYTFRGQFADSPRALYRALATRLGPDIRHTWLCTAETEHTFPTTVETVPMRTPEAVAALESADVVIANDCISMPWRKRPGTVYLQTWHGTPLKRIHHDVADAPEGWLTQADLDVARWDHLLSPNIVTSERLRRAFGYRGPVHETGLPRNDLLNGTERASVRARVRAALGIADHQTAVLYTPTWRDDLVFHRSEGRDFELAIDLEDFHERLGSDHVLLLRLHHMVSDRLSAAESTIARDVSRHPDVGELYLAADIMVTDYSSTMFDFAVTGKPLLLYTYDYERFRDQLRGFYFDLEAVAPTPLLGSSKELIDAIVDIETITAQHEERYARFRETFCHLEDGGATERALGLLFPSGFPARSGNSGSTDRPVHTATSEGDENRADL